MYEPVLFASQDVNVCIFGSPCCATAYTAVCEKDRAIHVHFLHGMRVEHNKCIPHIHSRRVVVHMYNIIQYRTPNKNSLSFYEPTYWACLLFSAGRSHADSSFG